MLVAVAGVDRHAERRVAVGRVLASSRGICSWLSRSGIIARQIRPRPCLRHEVDRVRRHRRRRHGQIALVLAILVVDDDDHAAIADGLDGLFDGGEGTRAVRAPLAMRIFELFRSYTVSPVRSTASQHQLASVPRHGRRTCRPCRIPGSRDRRVRSDDRFVCSHVNGMIMHVEFVPRRSAPSG